MTGVQTCALPILMSSHELTFSVFRFKKVVKNIFSARLGLHDAGKKIMEHNHNLPLSISFGEISINQIQNLLFKQIKCINHPTRRRMFPLMFQTPHQRKTYFLPFQNGRKLMDRRFVTFMYLELPLFQSQWIWHGRRN